MPGKSLGHRPVDPCLSRWVSQGHPAGVPRICLILCAFLRRKKKSIHHHRGTPLSRSVRSQSKKGYGVYHFPGKTRETGIHHRSEKKGLDHRGLRPGERKNRRVSTVVYTFVLPCFSQKGLEVCYCLWGCHPDPRLGPVLGPSRFYPGSEGVPSRFAMCFVFQHFGPIQVPRWGPSRPILVPSCSRAFLPGSGLDGPKQTSRPLPILFVDFRP